MKIYTEDLNDYRPWSGAVDTYKTRKKAKKNKKIL